MVHPPCSFPHSQLFTLAPTHRAQCLAAVYTALLKCKARCMAGSMTGTLRLERLRKSQPSSNTLLAQSSAAVVCMQCLSPSSSSSLADQCSARGLLRNHHRPQRKRGFGSSLDTYKGQYSVPHTRIEEDHFLSEPYTPFPLRNDDKSLNGDFASKEPKC